MSRCETDRDLHVAQLHTLRCWVSVQNYYRVLQLHVKGIVFPPKWVWKRGQGDKRPHYQTTAHWSSTIISISSWKYAQIPAKTVKCILNFRFPHNIANLIVEEGWRRRARDKLRELYSELFTEIVLQLGRVYILSLSARTFLFWISCFTILCSWS